MTQKIGAVITGGDFQGLGVVRTLAKKNIPNIVLDSERCISEFSRYTNEFLKSPDPFNEDDYIDFIIDINRKKKIDGWVIIPNNDAIAYILSKNKKHLSNYYRVAAPDWESFKKVYIKKETYQIAEENNILTPKTYYPESVDDIMKWNFDYPVIIKPSIRDNFYNKIKIKAFLINDRESLIKTYQKVCDVIDPQEALIQDFIPGGPNQLYSFCPFFKEGKALAWIMAKRSRQHPMDFGHATTFAELVNISEMKEIGEKFLKLIDFYGIGEVEFMKDPRDGKFKLIEVNPRVWGWHTLAIAAGVDLPYLLYQDAIGEKIKIRSPIKNLKWVRLTTDIPTVMLEIFRGKMKFKDYWESMKGKKEIAIFDKNDPLPFFAEILMIPYLWIKRGF